MEQNRWQQRHEEDIVRKWKYRMYDVSVSTASSAASAFFFVVVIILSIFIIGIIHAVDSTRIEENGCNAQGGSSTSVGK